MFNIGPCELCNDCYYTQHRDSHPSISAKQKNWYARFVLLIIQWYSKREFHNLSVMMAAYLYLYIYLYWTVWVIHSLISLCVSVWKSFIIFTVTVRHHIVDKPIFIKFKLTKVQRSVVHIFMYDACRRTYT